MECAGGASPRYRESFVSRQNLRLVCLGVSSCRPFSCLLVQSPLRCPLIPAGSCGLVGCCLSFHLPRRWRLFPPHLRRLCRHRSHQSVGKTHCLSHGVGGGQLVRVHLVIQRTWLLVVAPPISRCVIFTVLTFWHGFPIELGMAVGIGKCTPNAGN